jgi:hypothetical protein
MKMKEVEAFYKYELYDATTGDGAVWVGLMTASHPTRFSIATVWIYCFGVDHNGIRHGLEGGKLAGTASYQGRQRLIPLEGNIPEHVLDHMMAGHISKLSKEDPP